MKLRTELVNEIHEKIEVNGWSQKEAAEHLGITQPRVSEMLRGKLSKFSLDSLVNMLASVLLFVLVELNLHLKGSIFNIRTPLEKQLVCMLYCLFESYHQRHVVGRRLSEALSHIEQFGFI